MCVFSFSGETDIEEYLKYGKTILESYANGSDIEIKIIK